MDGYGPPVATLDECEAAVRGLAAQLAALDPEVRERHLADRTVSCHLVDLRVLLLADLSTEGLSAVRTVSKAEAGERAQVRVSVSSDDLVALLGGDLGVKTAWATGRLRVQAPPMDLLRLRAALPTGGR